MKKKFIIAIAIGIILIILAIVVSIYMNKPKQTVFGNVVPSASGNGNHEQIKITKENFPSYLSGQEFVKNLPKNAIINLKLYNFNTGEREWEGSYTLSKASIKEGEDSNADMTIMLSSKYIELANQYDFCSLIKLANQNGDLGYEFHISKASLMWKYSGMMKYKDCLG